MKILLINPPFKSELGKFSREQRSPAITKSGTFYYPMWLAYATGVLEAAGHECRLIDAPAGRLHWDACLAKLGDFRPSLCVVDTSTPSIANDVRAAAALKEKFGAFTVAVGPHPSALPEETLKLDSGLDAAARREYEFILRELAALLERTGGRPSADELKGVNGLAFRIGEKIIVNELAPVPENLDELPFVSAVYKKHLEFKDYFYAHSKHPIVTIISGRGCPHQCVYCVYPQVFNTRKVRNRSIANVVDEAEYILREFPGVKEIMFEDDTLTLNKARCLEFAAEIKRRGLKFEWSANSRADIDLETMSALRSAGARLFCVGIESGEQSVLDAMKKGLKVEKVRRFFRDAKAAGIMIHGCFLVGNPSETKATLERTLAFAKELEPDTAQFFPIMVYPGTEAYDWAVKNGYLKTSDFKDWLTEDGLHNCVLSRPGLTDRDLVAFCDRARKEFYLRPSYIVRKFAQGLTDAHEMKRLLIGGVSLAKHLLGRAVGK